MQCVEYSSRNSAPPIYSICLVKLQWRRAMTSRLRLVKYPTLLHNAAAARLARGSPVSGSASSHSDSIPADSSSSGRSTAGYYYNQAALDAAAEKTLLRLTLASMLYSGRTGDPHQMLLRSAQYLHRELPVRVAHRVADFRALPFVVGCNPAVLAVHELYMRAFRILSEFPAIVTLEDEAKYSGVIRQLLDDHKDVVTMLAEGLRGSGRHVRDPALVRGFLDKTLTARLGIRLLCEHHLAMRHERQDFVGVVCTKFCPGEAVEARAALVAKMCDLKYGQAPAVRVDGNGRRATFAYIPQPVDYMLTELLKNAFRATVEFNRDRSGPLPEILVTVANNDVDFIVQISDRGGGVPHSIADSIFEYNFSTAETSEQRESFLSRVCEPRATSPMHGFGFGLPLSRAYAGYLGGSLTFQTMQGIGSDFYLRLRHIDGRGGAVLRI